MRSRHPLNADSVPESHTGDMTEELVLDRRGKNDMQSLIGACLRSPRHHMTCSLYMSLFHIDISILQSFQEFVHAEHAKDINAGSRFAN